jgi:transcription elongation factor GreB
MSRYRPPPPKSSAYITPQGHATLQAELKELWKVKRPEVTRKVSEAAAMGDRSENAEYIYGKRQLREIDGRIQFLSKRLDALVVVDRAPPNQDKVYFGAWVSVREVDAGADTFRLVGPDEFDREPGFISIDSPMARALLGKSKGDLVDVNDRQYEIMAISYQS